MYYRIHLECNVRKHLKTYPSIENHAIQVDCQEVAYQPHLKLDQNVGGWNIRNQINCLDVHVNCKFLFV